MRFVVLVEGPCFYGLREDHNLYVGRVLAAQFVDAVAESGEKVSDPLEVELQMTATRGAPLLNVIVQVAAATEVAARDVVDSVWKVATNSGKEMWPRREPQATHEKNFCDKSELWKGYCRFTISGFDGPVHDKPEAKDFIGFARQGFV